MSGTLLRQYARSGDEDAFRALVRDFIALVHGTAVRRLGGDETLARDVAQVVFCDLAKLAKTLPENVLLGGWLHRHTCFVASTFLRSETRRKERERISAEMSAIMNMEESWENIAPALDEAINELAEEDRAAVVLRFFEGRDLRSVGQALRVSEDAAQKRIHRAVEKLRLLLQGKGIHASIAALTGFLGSKIISEVSAGTVEAISAAALASGGVQFSPFLLLLMKTKLAAVIIIVAALLAFLLWKKQPNQKIAGKKGGEPVATDQSGSMKNQSLALAGSNSPAAENSVGASSNSAPADRTEKDPSAIRILSVHVMDAHTHGPLNGAVVRVSEGGSNEIQQNDANSKMYFSDKAGLANVPIHNEQARLQLGISKDGYAGWLSMWDPSKGEKIPAEHTVSLESGVLIGGRVIDIYSNAVEGAEVNIVRTWMGGERIDRSSHRVQLPIFKTTTNPKGEWWANHIPENLLAHVRIGFSHPYFASTNKIVDEDLTPLLRDQSWILTLHPGARLFGRVTDTNGVPIPKAKVSFAAQYRSNRQESGTDDDGVYEIRNVIKQLPDVEVVTVVATGFQPASKTTPVDGNSIEMNFTLSAGGIIRGRVVDSKQKPIAKARVSREQPFANDGLEWSAQTDSEGRFEWNGTPLIPQTFYFGDGAHEQLRGISLEPGEKEHVIVMPDKRKVHGTVKDAATGKFVEQFFVLPAEGTVSQLSSWSSSAEQEFKNGKFEFELNEARQNVLKIRAPGFIPAIYETPLNPDNESVDGQLHKTAEFAGAVLNPAGLPVARIGVAPIGNDRANSLSLGRGRITTR